MWKQFWALFKFQSTINSYLWWVPIVFGMPLLTFYFGSFSAAFHPGLSSLLFDQNLFFVGIIGATILGPERLQFGGTSLTSGIYGTEFILTRAIDRRVLYRAKAALLFLLLLAMPTLGILNSLHEPDLVVTEYSKPAQKAFVSSLPGSMVLATATAKVHPSLISIPRGNILLAEWHFGVFLMAGLSLQALILILYPLKHAKFLFWILFFGLVFVPLFNLFDFHNNAPPALYERAFLLFAADRCLAWILTAIVFVLGQLWCERRFAQLEQ